MPAKSKLTDRERLDTFLFPDPNSGCFLFVGSERGGYGRFRMGEKVLDAHVAAWLLAGKLIPQGMKLMHTCDTPSCCNVDHLKLGTHAANMADMARKRRGTKSKAGLPRGVQQKSSGRFQATAGSHKLGNRIFLGTFDTAEEAGTVAAAGHRLLYGA